MTYTPQHIRRARLRAKLTQQQLADRLGVSRQAVRNWEAGRRAPAARYHGQLDELGVAAKAAAPRPNSRPKYADLEPCDWRAASQYGWAELKYDGEYGEIRGGPHGWTLTNRRGVETGRGSAPLPTCHLLVEVITGTEWARRSPLYGSIVAWAALSTKGVHLSRAHLVRLVAALQVTGLTIVESECYDIAPDYDRLWDYAVIKRSNEGLVFRTAGGKFARMKCRTSKDYVCTGSDQGSLIGALYTPGGKLVDRVRVPCPDPPRVGEVFEASGLAVTDRGSLRNPRWERWRPNKAPEECCK